MVDYNPYHDEVLDDPHSYYKQLRDEALARLRHDGLAQQQDALIEQFLCEAERALTPSTRAWFRPTGNTCTRSSASN